ncbi:uncharacterized protein C8Q71DRAFT_861955 [Rhodofomes roseus]|uniref:Uncharacterized protein n=1 Tax=Rhodofomes roseus TaxID=34475 RepID=A0ABQ8K310_9APHY|nr:uncharacterized protein C8Q71DRAFT_861955 [Rhodofomes roseus]KAH9831222.1 hypothetical protein C8Q71DRAFT_861955 [Rhodofomes roseus]
MRFGATFSLLFAAVSVAPLALALPFGAEGTDALEVRGVEFDSADFLARADYDDELLARDDEEFFARSFDDDETTLLARAVLEALEARNDPPHYSKHDPTNGKKPKYSEKDPNPPPKYRQKDPHKPDRQPKPKPGPSRPRDLAEVEEMWARDDPPPYSRHVPHNEKTPKYSAKDPNPPPKYRQKDPHKPNRQRKPRPGPSRPRDLAEVEDMWTRDDPPPYSKHDPIHGKKPKYSEKDPNAPPKYRQKDPHKPNRQPKPRPGPSRPRELADFWW